MKSFSEFKPRPAPVVRKTPAQVKLAEEVKKVIEPIPTPNAQTGDYISSLAEAIARPNFSSITADVLNRLPIAEVAMPEPQLPSIVPQPKTSSDMSVQDIAKAISRPTGSLFALLEGEQPPKAPQPQQIKKNFTEAVAKPTGLFSLLEADVADAQPATTFAPTKAGMVQQVKNALSEPKFSKNETALPNLQKAELDGIRTSISNLMSRVNTLSMGGGGTGIVRIGMADDFDPSTYADGRYLRWANNAFRLQEFNGGATANVVSKTYSQLKSMVDSSALEPGTLYKITDFQTIYDQPDFNGDGTAKVTVSTLSAMIEPLIVFCVAPNKIESAVYSTEHPSDYIEYDITFTQTEVMNAPAKGRITRRIDERNNESDYDIRHVLFKRYESSPGSNVFSIVYDNGNSSRADIPTFDEVSFNNKIQNFYTTLKSPEDDWGFILSNNVFLNNSYNNTTGSNFFNNTFLDSFHDNDIMESCSHNLFTGAAFHNSISSMFSDNVIGNNFYHNEIGDEFQFNTIGEDFRENTIANAFRQNIISDNFSSNHIGNDFTNPGITIGANFRLNYIGNEFQYNTSIGTNFQRNVILNRFTNNTVANGIQDLHIASPYISKNITEGGITIVEDLKVEAAFLANTFYVTANTYTVSVHDYYVGINCATTCNVTLPAANTGRIVIIKDESGNAQLNPINILGTIDNDTGGATIKINNGAIQLIYRNGWRII